MINNLLGILNYENIYLIANWGVIPFWLLLIFLPNNQITNLIEARKSFEKRPNENATRKSFISKEISNCHTVSCAQDRKLK